MAHGERGRSAVDTDSLARTIEQHPVRLAVLFGSQVRGTATVESDVDVAAALEESLSAAERLEARIELTTALAKALGTDDVDVTNLGSVRPAVGARAVGTGVLLVGDRTLLEEYRERFAPEAGERAETHAERMRRFDALLERLETRV